MSLTRLALLAFVPVFAPGAHAADLDLLPSVLGVTERMQAQTLSGFALDGFDPVTYFLPGGPKPGHAHFETEWRGVAWRVATEANREAFLRSPETYAPRLGGHDPMAALAGRVVEAQPGLFAVVNMRLYLFRNAMSQREFLADPATAARAEERWNELRNQLVQP